MHRTLWRSDAVRAVILLLGAVLILSLYPLRLWQRIITETGGGVRMEASEQIDDGHDLIQDFIAQYDRLDSIEIYLDHIVSGRSLELTVYDWRMVRIYHKYVDFGENPEPGPVRIPLGLDLEVGKQYRLFFMGLFSGYTLGLQNIPEGASPYLTELYMHDSLSETWKLDVAMNYQQPIDKKTSLVLILLIAGAAILLERITALLARRRGREKDCLVTVRETVRAVLLPVLFICWLTLLLLVFPMKKFDDRPADIVFYFLGILLAGGWAVLCLPSEKLESGLCDAGGRRAPFFGGSGLINVVEMIQMAAFALSVQAANRYMNGLTDADHAAASRGEVLWLLVFFLLFLIGPREKKTGGGKWRLNLFGALMLLFAALASVLSNGRLWLIALAALFAGGLLCFFFSPRRERWLPLVTGGLILNFFCNVLFCLLHRYFAGFVSARFPFIFHTVTVTSEYLSLMAATAFVLLFAAVRRAPAGSGARVLLYSIRWEALFFGTVSSYLMFTASRNGLATVGGSVLVLLIVMGFRGKREKTDGGEKSRRLPCLLAAFLSFVLAFPAVFTLQRIVPPMVARPVFYEVEDTAVELKGAPNWNNRYFISVERFCSLLLEKYTIVYAMRSDYPEDWWNYREDGSWAYLPVGVLYTIPKDLADRLYEETIESKDDVQQEEINESIQMYQWESEIQPTAVYKQERDKQKEEESIMDEDSVTDVVSNGRLTIWRSYLPALNLTGHREMGVPLPNGTLAVHAHNVYLQMAYDGGMIVGLVFGVVILAAILTAAVFGRADRDRRGSSGAAMRGAAFVPLALTMSFAVTGLAEWNFHLGNMMTVTMLVSWIPLCFKKK